MAAMMPIEEASNGRRGIISPLTGLAFCSFPDSPDSSDTTQNGILS
jgi:hypothetical protein